jgi:hypothetical protein
VADEGSLCVEGRCLLGRCVSEEVGLDAGVGQAPEGDGDGDDGDGDREEAPADGPPGDDEQGSESQAPATASSGCTLHAREGVGHVATLLTVLALALSRRRARWQQGAHRRDRA